MKSSVLRDSVPTPVPTRRVVGSWLFGLAALAAVVAVAAHFAEMRELWSAVRKAKPAWLFSALALQALTYVAQGEIFCDVARAGRCGLRRIAAYRISLIKLFFDQALPSAGLSGTAVAAGALKRVGMPRQLVAASVIVSIASYEIAYATSLLAALPVVAAHGGVSGWLELGVSVFALAALSWSVCVLALAGRRQRSPKVVSKLPPARELLAFVADADPSISRDRRLLARASFWQLAIIVADAATLWALLEGLGAAAAPLMVFASFMLSNVFRAIGLVPGGLGTFEGAAVVTLHAAGVSVSVALAATLLFRALSFWLPMPLGFYVYQRTQRPR